MRARRERELNKILDLRAAKGEKEKELLFSVGKRCEKVRSDSCIFFGCFSTFHRTEEKKGKRE